MKRRTIHIRYRQSLKYTDQELYEWVQERFVGNERAAVTYKHGDPEFIYEGYSLLIKKTNVGQADLSVFVQSVDVQWLNARIEQGDSIKFYLSDGRKIVTSYINENFVEVLVEPKNAWHTIGFGDTVNDYTNQLYNGNVVWESHKAIHVKFTDDYEWHYRRSDGARIDKEGNLIPGRLTVSVHKPFKMIEKLMQLQSSILQMDSDQFDNFYTNSFGDGG